MLSCSVQDYGPLSTIHGLYSGYTPSFGQAVVRSDYVSPWQIGVSREPSFVSNYPTPVMGSNAVNLALENTNKFSVDVNRATDLQFTSGFKIIEDKSKLGKKQS